MPTVVHSDFDFIYKSDFEVFEISDGLEESQITQGDSRLYAHIALTPERNIRVDVTTDAEGKNLVLGEGFLLQYQMHSHNGLFKYLLDIPDQGTSLITVKADGSAEFPCDIYNRIKEIYHRHNYHNVNDGDSVIKPYMSLMDVDIQSENNAALTHYLDQYERKFKSSFLFLSDIYDRLILMKRLSLYWKLMIGKGKHGVFYQMATRIKGDKTYCNTLFQSVYNSDASKEARRRTFNINNINESVSVMVERINNRFSLSMSVISFWLAFFAIILSIVFFALSLK